MHRLSMLALVGLLLSACAAQGPVNWLGTMDRAVPYDTTLVRWTRHTTAYRNLDSLIFARATLLSPAFINAYGRELTRVSGMDTDHVERLKSRLAGSGKDQLRFLLTILTAEPEWNDLETDTASLTVHLATGAVKDGLNKAERISVITDDEMADLRTLFTGIDPMARGYFVTFPMPTNLDSLTLRVSGPPTYADLRWDIR